MTTEELTFAITHAVSLLTSKLIFNGLMLIILLAVVGGIVNYSTAGRDDTDQPGWGGKRSGVKPITDYGTGCQYLVTPDGGITPRLDKDGRHMCIKGDAHE